MADEEEDRLSQRRPSKIEISLTDYIMLLSTRWKISLNIFVEKGFAENALLNELSLSALPTKS